MEIYFEKTNRTKLIELEREISLKEFLEENNITTESVILVKNNEICLESDLINNKDKIKILSVVSGG